MQPIEILAVATLGIVVGALLVCGALLAVRRLNPQPFDEASKHYAACIAHLLKVSDEHLKVLAAREQAFATERYEYLSAIMRPPTAGPKPLQPATAQRQNSAPYDLGPPPSVTSPSNGRPPRSTVDAGSV